MERLTHVKISTNRGLPPSSLSRTMIDKTPGAVNLPSARKHRLKSRLLAGLDVVGDKNRLRVCVCGTVVCSLYRRTANQCNKPTGEQEGYGLHKMAEAFMSATMT